MIKEEDNNKVLTLEQQINNIFFTVTRKNLQAKTIDRIKQIMKIRLQELIQQALKRALLRKAPLAYLDIKDLLYVIEKQNPKYRNKVGQSIMQGPLIESMNRKEDDKQPEELQDQDGSFL